MTSALKLTTINSFLINMYHDPPTTKSHLYTNKCKYKFTQMFQNMSY